MKKSQIIIISAFVLSIIAIIISIFAINSNKNNNDSKVEKTDKVYSVFLNKDATPEEIEILVNKLKENNSIIDIMRISKEEAIKNLKTRLKDKVEDIDNLLDSNSFSEGLSVYAHGTDKELHDIQKLLEKEKIVKSVR